MNSVSTISMQSTASTSTIETVCRRRKKRTSIELSVRGALEKAFIANPKPTSEELTELSENLKMDKEVVRVWYCNRRQKEKRSNQGASATMMMSMDEDGADARMHMVSPSSSSSSTSSSSRV